MRERCKAKTLLWHFGAILIVSEISIIQISPLKRLITFGFGPRGQNKVIGQREVVRETYSRLMRACFRRTRRRTSASGAKSPERRLVWAAIGKTKGFNLP